MKTIRRKVRDEADARECLAAAARSGKPRSEWARTNDVDGRSLNMWRLHLDGRAGRGAGARPTLRLVELVSHDYRRVPDAKYVVRLGDVAVEVDDGFDDVTLRRLLAVVAAC